MPPYPIRLTVADDLRRSRLTVFFRLLLAIPHVVWLVLWTLAAIVAAVVNWFATLIGGRSPLALHRFLAAYVRYGTHLTAFLFLAANPFPGFTGTAGTYPVDLEIDPPERQRRLVTAFRLVLVLPALALASVLAGGAGGGGGAGTGSGTSDPDDYGSFFLQGGGAAAVVAFFGWFASLARGRMPRGFRDLAAYGVGYSAQALGYLFLLTDRYPNSDPAFLLRVEPVPEHPIAIAVADDQRRSRLTVLFRLLLAIPHFIWWLLWSILAFLVAIANWVATLATGRPPRALHAFLSSFVRYGTHVSAYVSLVANPFPGFTGSAAAYPIDLAIPAPGRQNRWITGFRLLLAIPAFVVAGALDGALFVVAVLGWFAALATGRMPTGLRNLGALVLRYSAQTEGYLFLLTDRYPFSSPAEPRVAPPEPPAEPAAA
ncbi:MAG: DUF4389 domain-containing protein [Gaiellaceae bacterium]